LSAIVVYGCQGLRHALSRDILNGFHLIFFSTSLYPFLILFIQYVVFSTLVLVAPSGPRVPDYCASLRSRIPPVTLYWFPVASFPVQGILSISTMDLESKYCYFYHNMIIGVHPVRCCIIRYSTSQFHRKYHFEQEEEEMKLCLMILSVPWYMFNGLENTAILSHF
jgi:hypothetical protein